MDGWIDWLESSHIDFLCLFFIFPFDDSSNSSLLVINILCWKLSLTYFLLFFRARQPRRVFVAHLYWVIVFSARQTAWCLKQNWDCFPPAELLSLWNISLWIPFNEYICSFILRFSSNLYYLGYLWPPAALPPSAPSPPRAPRRQSPPCTVIHQDCHRSLRGGLLELRGSGLISLPWLSRPANAGTGPLSQHHFWHFQMFLLPILSP